MNLVEVIIDSRRRDCFAVIHSQSAVTSQFVGSRIHLELKRAGHSPIYVAALVQDKADWLAPGPITKNVKMNQICLSPTFALDLGVQAGDVCSMLPLTSAVVPAVSVTVAPASVDDSEVVELNALRIEAELLRVLQLVFPRQCVTISFGYNLTAKLIVQDINPQGASIKAAMLTEGTELHVAVRCRQLEEQKEGDAALPPRSGLIRVVHSETLPSSSPALLRLTAAQAAWHRVKKGDIVGVLNLAETPTASSVNNNNTNNDPMAKKSDDGPFLSASQLRALAARVAIDVIPADSSVVGEEGATLQLPLPTSQQQQSQNYYFPPMHLLLLINPPDIVSSASLWGLMERHASKSLSPCCVLGGCPSATVADGALRRAFDATEQQQASEGMLRAFSLLCATHGKTPLALHQLLRSFAGYLGSDYSIGRHNVLLTGAKGSGKTSIALFSAATVRGLYVHYLTAQDPSSSPATTGAFLKKLEDAKRQCRLHAPSVLILDSFHLLAPAQQDGHVKAVAPATISTLQQLLHISHESKGRCCNPTALVPSLSLTEGEGFHGVTVLCIAEGTREDLHESVRGAASFGTILRVEPLTNRQAIIDQELECMGSYYTPTIRKHLVKYVEGYAPFDLMVATQRVRQEVLLRQQREGKECPSAENPASIGLLRSDLERICDGITPLSREGTNLIPHNRTSDVSWLDIGGLPEVKKVLHDSLVLPLKYPKLFASLPLKTRSGVLLFGPSGCGKSFVMQTVAAAEKLNCIVVNGPEMFGKYIGQSEQRIRDVFERAHAAAPSVVFFDEFESLAPQRGNDNSGVTDRVVNQLLCYLDGVEGRSGVTVVAASSRPDLIDAALLRPGRLDKAVYCSLPTLEERADILQAHARRVPMSKLSEEDWRQVAAETEDWTSADLGSLVSNAVLKVTQKTIDLTRELAALHMDGGKSEEIQEGAGGVTDSGELNPALCGTVLAAPSLKQKQAVEDALFAHADVGQQPKQATHSKRTAELAMTLQDVLETARTTRRSMANDAVRKQKAFYQRFIASREPQGASMVQAPGTKLASM